MINWESGEKVGRLERQCSGKCRKKIAVRNWRKEYIERRAQEEFIERM